MGQPIWDYCHQCDHEELRDALNGRHLSISEVQNGPKDKDCRPQVRRDFYLRLKCTLTKNGRSVNIKSASYKVRTASDGNKRGVIKKIFLNSKVIHITGHVAFGKDDNDKEIRQLISIGCPLPHPANIETPLGSNIFFTKHTLDMKFSYVDEK